MPKKPDPTQQALAYGQAWSTLVRAEAKAVGIARQYLGDEAFVEQSGPFLELSFATHESVDALKAVFMKSYDAPVEQRAAFMKSYIAEMPTHLENLYHGTLSLARALRDVIPQERKLQKEASKLVDELEALQPERAAEYRSLEDQAKTDWASRKGSPSR